MSIETIITIIPLSCRKHKRRSKRAALGNQNLEELSKLILCLMEK
jgi:hypothetical protein